MTEDMEREFLSKIATLMTIEELEGFRGGLRDQRLEMTGSILVALADAEAKLNLKQKRRI